MFDLSGGQKLKVEVLQGVLDALEQWGSSSAPVGLSGGGSGEEAGGGGWAAPAAGGGARGWAPRGRGRGRGRGGAPPGPVTGHGPRAAGGLDARGAVNGAPDTCSA